jgi:hypothetical protein
MLFFVLFLCFNFLKNKIKKTEKILSWSYQIGRHLEYFYRPFLKNNVKNIIFASFSIYMRASYFEKKYISIIFKMAAIFKIADF